MAPLGWVEMSGVWMGFLVEMEVRVPTLRGLQNCGVSVSYSGGVRMGDWLPHSLSLLEQEGGVGGK